jgi:hypothetical protein
VEKVRAKVDSGVCLRKTPANGVSPVCPLNATTMTTSDIRNLAASLAADPTLARLALAAGWHPDFTDKQHAELKRQIRNLIAAQA